jgi:hypothetical protein
MSTSDARSLFSLNKGRPQLIHKIPSYELEKNVNRDICIDRCEEGYFKTFLHPKKQMSK